MKINPLKLKNNLNIFTIDIEEWFHILDIRDDLVRFENWNNLETRVERNTDIILEIFDKYSTKATFFVLGWIAEKIPKLIKKIKNMGHEIASHGYKHELIYEIGIKKFKEDIDKSKKILQDITGQKILGYRGPGFSIKKENLWALKAIAEAGYLYDSTIFPAKRGHGGIEGFYRFPFKIVDT
ncbi:MAG: polysaccharide deacetylase family protein [Deltaproteobacteria bacterium]|nr:polysaccharide deacetylase family protein [Deltaproteobacteria bacterium]